MPESIQRGGWVRSHGIKLLEGYELWQLQLEWWRP